MIDGWLALMQSFLRGYQSGFQENIHICRYEWLLWCLHFGAAAAQATWRRKISSQRQLWYIFFACRGWGTKPAQEWCNVLYRCIGLSSSPGRWWDALYWHHLLGILFVSFVNAIAEQSPVGGDESESVNESTCSLAPPSKWSVVSFCVL